MGTLSLVFVLASAVDLANYPPVSPDESWIMSASYKLAEQGILGSDMFAGYYHADEHYLVNPPVQHLLQAAVFRAFGAGIAQARALSLAEGVLLLWVAGALAYRWFGGTAGLLAAILLVFWRSSFSSSQTVVTLADLALSARYDVTLLAWAWLTILLLDAMLRRPRRLTGLLLGLAAGAALLTQFFGVLVVPLIAISWLWLRGRQAFKTSHVGWIALGGLLLTLPYALFVARFADDLAGQYSINAFRTDFGPPAFYLDNLRREPGDSLALPGASFRTGAGRGSVGGTSGAATIGALGSMGVSGVDSLSLSRWACPLAGSGSRSGAAEPSCSPLTAPPPTAGALLTGFPPVSSG